MRFLFFILLQNCVNSETISSKRIYASTSVLKQKDEILIIQDINNNIPEYIIHPYIHFYPIFEDNIQDNIPYTYSVGLILAGIINNLGSETTTLLRPQSHGLKSLRSYISTSFLDLTSDIETSYNKKRRLYLTPEEIKKFTIYNNSAFVFFLTGKESNSMNNLLSSVKNKGTEHLKGDLNSTIDYKYCFVCVLMTPLAEKKYLKSGLCSNSNIVMKKTTEKTQSFYYYNHNSNPSNASLDDTAILLKTRGEILDIAVSYNPPSYMVNMKESSKTKMGLNYLSIYKNSEIHSKILKSDEHLKQLSEELGIPLRK